MTVKMDEGLAFGLGVFETIAIEQKKPLFLKEHLDRMRRGAKTLGFWNKELEEKISLPRIFSRLESQPSERGALKIIATPKNVVFSWRDNPYQKEDYDRGFSLKISQIQRNETSPLTYMKTLNYGDNIMEKRKALSEGADEPVFLNSRGEFAEGATTNLFFVKDGEIFTPAVSCGLLPGVVRGFVMENFSVREQRIFKEERADFEEVFVTNSLLGIMPVRRLGDKEFTERRFVQKVQKKYRNLIL
ncbi:MAG: aminotransferase class IV [Ruminococcus sp.]|jgi:4-amino-4-deoxychorismate lyase